MKVGIVVYDGFDELDAVAPYEVLKNATAAGASTEVRLVTLGVAAQVKASHGLMVVPEGTFDDGFQWLIIPGASWLEQRPIDVASAIERSDLPRVLARQFEAGVGMASVCTGALLLSAAGITRGRAVTTHHTAIEALRREGGRIIAARVVDDGNLITSAGVTSGIDLGLWFVERHFGRAMADSIARQMEYPRTASVWAKDIGRP